MFNVRPEVMNNVFTKYHITGLPFQFTPHHFTGVEQGAIHDHPWNFTTHIISRSYIEKVYRILPNGTWETELVHRQEGTSHRLLATHIHEIVELPEGPCGTIVVAEHETRTPCFWEFTDNGILFRKWFEPDFKPYLLSTNI